MSARRPCAVELCPSMATARRVVCCVHAQRRAFTASSPWLVGRSVSGTPDEGEPPGAEWLCLRCATDRIRNGQAPALRVVPDQQIHDRNRAARTAAERACCGQCGRFLSGRSRPRRRKFAPPAQTALSLAPPARR